MDRDGRKGLRKSLLRFVRGKFTGLDGIEALAEDIVQEAYRSLLESPGYETSKENFAYLSAIASHVALTHLRQLKILPVIDPQPDPDGLAGKDDPSQALLDNEAAELVRASVSRLGRAEKTVIDLRYCEGLSFREISEETGVALNTVLSRHRRALGHLRDRLAMYVDEAPESAYGASARRRAGRYGDFIP